MRKILLGLILLLAAAARAQEPPGFEGDFLVITKTPQRFPVAVPNFLVNSTSADDQAVGQRLTELLRQNFQYSGVLQILDPKSYLTPLSSGPEDFSAWTLIGAEALVRGFLTRTPEGRVQIELRLYDLARQEMVLGKRFTGSEAALRQMVHRFSDDVLEWLTGRRGSFETQIALVSDQSGRKEIHVMDSDGGNPRPVTNNHTLNLAPEWWPNSSRLLYTSYKAKNPDLYVLDTFEGKEWRISNRPGLNVGAAFRPDGKRIALVLTPREGNSDIFLLNPDGSGLTQVTSSWAIDVSPAWSPDGKFLAFVSDRGGTPQIYMLDLSRGAESENNRPVRLTWEGDYNSSPAWSPDGQRIAFAGRRAGQFDLMVIELGKGPGGSVRALTETPFNEEDPAWSPDGRSLAFASDRYGNYDIFSISVYGGAARRLTEWPSAETAPAWSSSLKR
jgi:TolB protein